MKLILAVFALYVLLSCQSAYSKPEEGKYKIIKAYALIHDQGPIREVSSKLIGDIVEVSKGKITIANEKFSFELLKNLSIEQFEMYHAGMDYEGISSGIFEHGERQDDCPIPTLSI